MPAQPTSPILAACSFDHMHLERLAGPCTIYTKVLACSSSNNPGLAASRPLLPGLVYQSTRVDSYRGNPFPSQPVCRVSVSHAPREADGHHAVRADRLTQDGRTESSTFLAIKYSLLASDLAGCNGSTDLAAAL
ncbi:hypothetical protein V8C44DRAFT_353446 [Trichoderma aethiopicum]